MSLVGVKFNSETLVNKKILHAKLNFICALTNRIGQIVRAVCLAFVSKIKDIIMKYSKIFSVLLAILAISACTFPAGPPEQQGARGNSNGGTVGVVPPR
jgi:hypothetical protein